MAALRDAIALLPRGVAWSKSPDSRLGKLLDALTRELDRVEARAADLLREANPATATELLAEWDAIVALDYPALSTTEPDASLARVAIAWLLGTSTLSRESIERYCALSELAYFADGDGVTRPLYRLLSVEHTDTHEATIRLLADGGSNSVVEALFRRKAHATGTLIFFWPAPFISISSPADASIACNDLVTVTGTSLGVGTVQVVVTESGGLVSTYTTTADPDTGAWSVPITLATYLDGEPATIVARGYTGIVTADSGWVESTPVEVTSEFSVSVSFTGPLTTTASFPTFTGTATPGSTIVIELRGDTEAPVVADGSGDWSVEMVNQGLELGANELTIYVTGPGPCEHEDSIVVEVERESGAGVPVNTLPPVVTGTVEIGEVLSCSTGTWTNSPTSYAYQWQRDGVDIGGATASTHTVVDGDIGPGTGGVGTGIRCVVTPTNGSGSGTPEPSNAVAFDDAAYLPNTAIGVSTAGLTLADSGTTVDSWAPTLGGLASSTPAAVTPSSSARPAYSATGGVGGRPLVTGDGVVDSLVGASVTRGAAWLNSEIGCVGRRVAFGTASDTFVGYMDAMFVNDRSTALFRFTVTGGGSIDSTSDPDTAPMHMSGDSDGSAINTRVAGSVQRTLAAAQPSRADAQPYSLFSSTIGTRFANIGLQAWYIGGKLTADQRTHLRALLTYLTGVAC